MTTATPTLINLIHRAGQIADERFIIGRGAIAITPRQQTVLAAIAELDEPSQRDLVDATGIDRSTMTDIVRRLTRRGLVTRKRTRSDARRYALRLTDEGAAEAQRAGKAAKTASDALIGKLPPKLRGPFVQALQTLAAP